MPFPMVPIKRTFNDKACILPQYFCSFVQLTNLNQNWHLLSRGNIIFVGIRTVNVYQILFNEIFMFFTVFLYKTI